MDKNLGPQPPRLIPTMSSRKALVLDFVTAWIRDHPGSSPSLSEIGRGSGISKQHAAALVRQLICDGKLMRRPGAVRALVLPDDLQRALQLIRDAGLGGIGDGSDPDGLLPPLRFTVLPMLPAME
ncbi:MAG: hypothetical protein ACRYHC_10790 [Janthinobacterium lividum]